MKRKILKSKMEDYEFLTMKYGKEFEGCDEVIRSDVRRVNPGGFVGDYEILHQIPL